MAAEASTTTAVGALLNGNYLLERIIAEGGMGVVYDAAHVRLPRRFAVKVLSKPKESGLEVSTALARFRREAEIASSLAHPHIVEVFDFQVSEGGSPYLVMELLDGEDLADRLKRTGRMAPVAALRIIDEVAQALDCAHTGGVVHRDLKPANIFLSRWAGRDDFVKVLDFGVSKLIDSATLTQEKAMVGTPLYMSPEQAVGTQELTPESDIFSLGAIAFEMLTGRRAFAAASIPSILYQIVHGPTPSVHKHVPALGPEIDEIFNRVLAKKKKERFQRATEFSQALMRALERPSSGEVRLWVDDAVPHIDPTPSARLQVAMTTGEAAQTEVDQSTHAEEAMPEAPPSSSVVSLAPKRSGWGLGVAVAAALVAGGGFAFVKWGAGKHVAMQQNSPAVTAAAPAPAEPPKVAATAAKGAQPEAAEPAPANEVKNVATQQNSATATAPEMKNVAAQQNSPAADPKAKNVATQQNSETAANDNNKITVTSLPANFGASALAATARAQKHPDVVFTFHVVPRGAAITVDDRPVHGQQVTLAWQPHPRHVRVVAAGYHPLVLQAPSSTRTFELRMERLERVVHPPPAPHPPAHPPRPVHDAAPVQDL